MNEPQRIGTDSYGQASEPGEELPLTELLDRLNRASPFAAAKLAANVLGSVARLPARAARVGESTNSLEEAEFRIRVEELERQQTAAEERHAAEVRRLSAEVERLFEEVREAAEALRSSRRHRTSEAGEP